MQFGDYLVRDDYAMQEKTSALLGRSFDSLSGCNQYAPNLSIARVDTSGAVFRTIWKKSHFVRESGFFEKIIFITKRLTVRYMIDLSLGSDS